jgi:glycosyltransferase involved in cell wall biosynthesis
MNKKINVLYDVRLLWDTGKTGIYRVAYELIHGVSKSSCITPYAVINNNMLNDKASIDCHLLPDGFIIPEPKKRFLRYWFTKLFLSRRKLRKLVAKSYYYSRKELKRIQIYHSPFHVISDQIRREKGIIRFTTIYDLIAITNPNYFEDNIIDFISNVIGQLDESDRVFCISNYTREILLSNSKVRSENAYVVPLAASPIFKPISVNDASNFTLKKYQVYDVPYILSVCTLEIRKNLDTVIKSFVDLNERQVLPEGTKLVLVGQVGWKTERIDQALAGAEKYKNLIIITGYVPDEELAVLYSKAKVFIYMSLLEGFGLPPLEAMSCGTPVITSNTSSLPEVVGDSGILCDPYDIPEICMYVEKLFNDQFFHEEMSEKAYKRSQLFSWENYVEETIKIYKRVVEEVSISDSGAK